MIRIFIIFQVLSYFISLGIAFNSLIICLWGYLNDINCFRKKINKRYFNNEKLFSINQASRDIKKMIFRN